MMFKKILSLAMAISFVTLAGCNTMSGVGKDVQRGGEKLENSAEKHK
jgi:predicted small secreted protein